MRPYFKPCIKTIFQQIIKHKPMTWKHPIPTTSGAKDWKTQTNEKGINSGVKNVENVHPIQVLALADQYQHQPTKPENMRQHRVDANAAESAEYDSLGYLDQWRKWGNCLKNGESIFDVPNKLQLYTCISKSFW